MTDLARQVGDGRQPAAGRGHQAIQKSSVLIVVFVGAAWSLEAPIQECHHNGHLVIDPVVSAHEPRDAQKAFSLAQEIGNPWWTHRNGGYRRSLFDTSVRLRALRGTIDRALQRPLLGYGFGAEQWAFVNRYYAFNSGNPENGYVGMFLQTGFIGLALFLLALALCIVPGIRRPHATPWLVASLGAAAAGLAMGISQSFFHGVGGIAYIAFWTVVFLTAVGAMRAARTA